MMRPSSSSLFLASVAVASLAACAGSKPAPEPEPAPAPLPVVADEASRAKDWESFAGLVDACFGGDPAIDSNPKARLVAVLEDQRVLDRNDVEALISEGLKLPTWSSFLGAVAHRLVQGASARVIARLAAGVLRGAGSGA